ncbi:hypothetical protein J1614_004208 [Plenodomus biglobosus]|nr:hypothetical protein J1614_004208 [Plenodomus biglobosus]
MTTRLRHASARALKSGSSLGSRSPHKRHFACPMSRSSATRRGKLSPLAEEHSLHIAHTRAGQSSEPVSKSRSSELPTKQKTMNKLQEAESMAAQRLRKTFKYPSESDDEDAVEHGMDEQDRETLIQNLSSHDTSATHTYTLLLLILPLAPIPFYIPRLFALSTVFPSLISIASLLATAYTLYFLPLAPTEMEPINGQPVPSAPSRPARRTPPWEKPGEKPGQRPVPWISSELADFLAQWIVLVNRAVCGIFALYEVWLGSEWMQRFSIGGGFLPLVICMVILYARTELRIIDVEQLRVWQQSMDEARVKGT